MRYLSILICGLILTNCGTYYKAPGAKANPYEKVESKIKKDKVKKEKDLYRPSSPSSGHYKGGAQVDFPDSGW